MSRPHDGQRTFFHFGNPFRNISPKGSNISPELLRLLNSFEQNLAENLKKLKPKDISDFLSLWWMNEAMMILAEVHTSIKDLINELQFPVSEWDEKWIDMYLDGSVMLLDMCIALSSELSKLDGGQLLLQYVLHLLDISESHPSSEQVQRAHASLFDWMRQIESRNPKLESCLSIFQSLQASLHFPKVKSSSKGKVLMRALYGVKVVTVYISSIFVAALSGTLQQLIDVHVTGNFLWVVSFNDLRSAMGEEIRSHLSSGKVIMLKELEAVEAYAFKLHGLTKRVNYTEEPVLRSNGITPGEDLVLYYEKNTGPEESQSLKECITGLAEKEEKLSHELDFFSKQVNEFFQIVLTARDALLCNLRFSKISQESNLDEMRL